MRYITTNSSLGLELMCLKSVESWPEEGSALPLCPPFCPSFWGGSNAASPLKI